MSFSSAVLSSSFWELESTASLDIPKPDAISAGNSSQLCGTSKIVQEAQLDPEQAQLGPISTEEKHLSFELPPDVADSISAILPCTPVIFRASDGSHVHLLCTVYSFTKAANKMSFLFFFSSPLSLQTR